MRVLGKILYWLAVVAISLALLIALVLFFESRDTSEVDRGALLGPLLAPKTGMPRLAPAICSSGRRSRGTPDPAG
jgi:hypothetical protein